MNSILDRDTLKLLRIPFSFFLMPVFLFAVSRAEVYSYWKLLLVFIILHLLIYPASNGYNSYIDRDEGPIGGLEAPPQPTKKLLYTTLILDILGLALAIFVDHRFCLLLLAYILASRAYSSPITRLKSKPILGYLTVILFQGAITFGMVYLGISSLPTDSLWEHWPALVGSSLLIAGVYPLTQVYQHDADQKNGDITISILLGYKGTFAFSITMFCMATVMFYLEFWKQAQLNLFLTFIVFLIPVLIYFNRWMLQVWKDTTAANFKNTMRMNLIASVCMNLGFITMIIIQN